MCDGCVNGRVIDVCLLCGGCVVAVLWRCYGCVTDVWRMCDRSFLIVYNSEIATTGTHHNKIRLLPRYFTSFIFSKTAKYPWSNIPVEICNLDNKDLLAKNSAIKSTFKTRNETGIKS